MTEQRLDRRRDRRRWESYNRCKTCGACDGRCGLTIDDECLNCHETRKRGEFVLHADLDRTPEEIELTVKILKKKEG